MGWADIAARVFFPDSGNAPARCTGTAGAVGVATRDLAVGRMATLKNGSDVEIYVRLAANATPLTIDATTYDFALGPFERVDFEVLTTGKRVQVKAIDGSSNASATAWESSTPL